MKQKQTAVCKFLFLFSFVASFLYADVDQNKSIFSEKQEIYAQKKIKMCVDPNWMPFEHINRQGEYEGILAEYVKLFSRKLHISFVLVKTDNYSQSRHYLKEGKCDIIVGEQATEEITKTYFATKPYFVIPRAFVTYIDALLVHDFSQIAYSGSVGVLPGSPAQILLPELYPGIKLVTVENTDKGLQRVASRELVAFVNVLPALVYSIQQQGLSNVKISGTLPLSVKLSVLVNKNHPQLVPLLNHVIDGISREETQKILNKWVHVKYEKGMDYKILVKLSIFFLIILGFIAMRYLHMRKLKARLEEMHKILERKMQYEIEKNRQQQLLILQQNRLAQKGEMLSMIAHQWRQPLNALAILHEMFFLRYPDDHAQKQLVSEFTQRSRRLITQMSDTIDDFRNFFQTDKEEVRFSVGEVVVHAVSIVKPLLDHEKITLSVQQEEELFFTGFPNELGQAIINILNNAKDALSQTKDKESQKVIRIRIKKEFQKIKITICDNGGGIDEVIISQIYDPYFSTKLDKQGTGLGLYMTKIIIEEHMHGKIEVYNQRNGVCFVIVLG